MRGRYLLSLTSQFYYCPLPLKLDIYRPCGFCCRYCFARARGGNANTAKRLSFSPDALARRFERLEQHGAASVIDEFLARRTPIHIGGMSDPFPPEEAKSGRTLRVLRILADREYPAVLSTKGTVFAQDEYIDVIRRGRFVVQGSLSSCHERLLAKLESGTPGPNALLAALKVLHKEGIPTVARIQPILPTRERDAFEVLGACPEHGVRHVTVEHLKLPVEKNWNGLGVLKGALGIDVRRFFSERRAGRIGREWILPAEERLGTILALWDYAQTLGIGFAPVDNDFLPLGDAPCCCIGESLPVGFRGFFRYTYTTAVRQGAARNRISFSLLRKHWAPRSSIGQFVNSHSRLSRENGSGADLTAYIARNWNGSPNGNSPAAFYGVIDGGRHDRDGFRIYRIRSDLQWLFPAQSGSMRDTPQQGPRTLG